MKKNILIIILMLCLQPGVYSQTRFYSKEARISFFSKTDMENIVAKNNKALCIWDTASGQYEFSVLIKGFEFDRALMQEHFNENYMESDKYPKAAFKGMMITQKPLTFQADNVYNVNVEGLLTIHGVTKKIMVPATIIIKNGMISSRADFKVSLSDYKISVPAIVADKINKQISITVLVSEYKQS